MIIRILDAVKQNTIEVCDPGIRSTKARIIIHFRLPLSNKSLEYFLEVL
jgi:hypothetical protein